MRRPLRLSSSLALILAIFGIVCAAPRAHAQQVVTKNQFVAGLVDPTTGILTIKQVVNGQPTIFLTNPGHSYLTLRANGTWYSNNNVSKHEIADPLGSSLGTLSFVALDGGTTTTTNDTVT